MKLYGVRIFVDDIDRATVFYGEILGLTQNWAMPDMGAAGYALENAELIVEKTDPNGEDGHLVGRFVGVSIQVEDIAALYKDLIAKDVEFASPPTRQPWGGTLAHFKDAAGNTLTLLG